MLNRPLLRLLEFVTAANPGRRCAACRLHYQIDYSGRRVACVGFMALLTFEQARGCRFFECSKGRS